MRTRLLAVFAITIVSFSEGAEPRSTSELVNLGISLARAGRFDEAAAAYKQALTTEQHCVAAQVNLGLVYFKTGKFAAAIPPLDAASKLGLDSDQIHTLLSMSFYSLKKFPEAAPHFEVLFAREPKNTTLQYFLAESYMRSSQTGKLADFFDQLQLESPDSPVVHMLVGERYDKMSRVSEAIQEFQQAAVVAPTMPMIHFGLGYFYWEDHHFSEASLEFQNELLLNNGEAGQAKAYLGDISLREGDNLRAETLLREALQNDANVRIAHYDLGIILTEQNRMKEAAAEFTTAIELDPERPDAYYRLARICSQLGERPRASQLLARVKDLNASEHIPLTRTLSTTDASRPEKQ